MKKIIIIKEIKERTPFSRRMTLNFKYNPKDRTVAILGKRIFSKENYKMLKKIKIPKGAIVEKIRTEFGHPLTGKVGIYYKLRGVV